MLRMICAATAACFLAGAAIAFDNSTCGTFFVGEWSADVVASEKMISTYNADGTYGFRSENEKRRDEKERRDYGWSMEG